MFGKVWKAFNINTFQVLNCGFDGSQTGADKYAHIFHKWVLQGLGEHLGAGHP